MVANDNGGSDDDDDDADDDSETVSSITQVALVVTDTDVNVTDAVDTGGAD